MQIIYLKVKMSVKSAGYEMESVHHSLQVVCLVWSVGISVFGTAPGLLMMQGLKSVVMIQMSCLLKSEGY